MTQKTHDAPAADELPTARRQRRNREHLFYNQPDAVANFAHWGRMDCWGIEAAIALSFGKNPDVVAWKSSSKERSVECYTEMDAEFAGNYGRWREIVLSAVQAGYLTDPILSLTFIRWALSKRFDLPKELVQEVERCSVSSLPGMSVDGADESKPVQRQGWQETRILEVIKELGHEANALPRNRKGKRGVKFEVYSKVRSESHFTGTTVFKKAWERLSSQKLIEYSDQPYPPKLG